MEDIGFVETKYSFKYSCQLLKELNNKIKKIKKKEAKEKEKK